MSVRSEPTGAAVTTAEQVSTTDAASAVVVLLGGARYAVAMASVAEVGRVPWVTRVPGVLPWVAGVSNWRGRILPVVDLRPLLGSSDRSVGPDARIVVTGDDVTSVGLLVEEVDGVVDLPDDDLDAPPSTVTPDAAELLAGLVNGNGADDRGPIAVIDVAAVLRLRMRLPQLAGRKG